MHDLLEQIEAALEAGLFYVALMCSLALVDICAAIDSEDGYATGDKFRDWFDKYVAPRYRSGARQVLTGDDCYRFRCSLLHQGSSQHPASSYSRVLFIEPGVVNIVAHSNVLNDALNLDVRIFCHDLLEGTRRWLSEVEHTERFRANYSSFMRRYPDGLAPYIVGVPVIS